jgi:hypothetical protein
MNKTLYVLRRHPEEISHTLLDSSDAGIDVFFVEPSDSISYDDLVSRVFQADRTIVI